MTRAADDPLLDLAAGYALGALSPDESRRFEAFLATSREAQREVAEYREVAALLALGGDRPAPGSALRERVMARIAGEKVLPLRDSTSASGAGAAPAAAPEPARGGPPSVAWLALAASLLLAVGLGAALVSARARLAAVETELAAREQTLDRTREQLSRREAVLRSILEPGVQLFQLTASGDPQPGIQLFWNREQHRAVVHGYRLKAVASGQAYQLWFIMDGKPVPSITFKPEANGDASIEHVPVPAVGIVSAAAVTVEPEAGSSQPTSPIVLVGTLQKS